jgi:predicted aspartyl protease
VWWLSATGVILAVSGRTHWLGHTESMGTFTVSVAVGDLSRRDWVDFEALVDASSTYSVFPRPALERLGIRAEERAPFVLADERRVFYEIGEARLRIDGRERFVVVVFGDPDVEPLVGATTLELFSLGVDPVAQQLVPVDALLKPLTPR